MSTIHKALFVMSSQDHLTLKDGTQHPTGFYASEFVEPYDTFKQAGIQIDVATPDGRTPPVDPTSVDPRNVGAASAQRFQQGIAAAAELAHPRALRDVKASDYDLIFVPGGHAPVEDLPYDADLRRLLEASNVTGAVVAALCHGPAALLAGVDGQGSWLYAGRQLTSFSKTEEDLTPVAGRMKWELETNLRDHGAVFSRSAASMPFEGYVVHDGKLVTGENPASAGLIARKVLQVLDRPEGQSVSFSVHRDVAADPDTVWARIGRFDTLPWHPGLESGTLESPTRRRLVAKGGGPVFTEELTETGPHFLRYRMVDGLPVHPEGTLRVEPNGSGGTRITWEADVDTSGLAPDAAQGVTKGITAFYEAGLDALQHGWERH